MKAVKPTTKAKMLFAVNKGHGDGVTKWKFSEV
jgi:hypothetical protein